MSTNTEELKTFAKQLYEIGAIKFGEFKTKIGLITPVYCDLRVIISYPKLLDALGNLLVKHLNEIGSFDILCGVPYTALPIATIVSMKTTLPMVMRRKEAKSYGTKKKIEGVFKEGSKCLIIEDVVTSGSSILETVNDLNDAGIKCSDAVVLLNREQGGNEILKCHGINMHALFTLSQLMQYLKTEGCVDENTCRKVKEYLSSSQVPELKMNTDRLKLGFQERIKYSKNTITAKLMNIMISKQSNLCLAADVTDSTCLLNLAEEVGPYICALKTHIDIVSDFHPNLIEPLKEIAKRHDFLLFEDRKFSDIGKTVEYQYSKGIYKISSWADLVTVHSTMGRGVLDAIKISKCIVERGVFLLAEASSVGSLMEENYIKKTLNMSEEYPELITGIVCQSPLFRNNPGLLQLTPGVRIGCKEDNLGQQYNTPDHIVLELGADIAVVGRGITEADNPRAIAMKYQDELWNAYLRRTESS